jgi:uncharacterized phage protein (TIGR01671 family)
MRAIKFRAWIPAKVVGEHDYHSNGKAEMFYQDDQYLQSFLRRAYMMDCGREHESYISEGFTLLQYTGIKDANGREIYEGDITHGEGSPVWFKVEFVDGSFCLVPIHAHGEDVVARWTAAKATQIMPLHLVAKAGGPQGLEVIGNIYENPEFLLEPAQ